jgi:hypothetical protein
LVHVPSDTRVCGCEPGTVPYGGAPGRVWTGGAPGPAECYHPGLGEWLGYGGPNATTTEPGWALGALGALVSQAALDAVQDPASVAVGPALAGFCAAAGAGVVTALVVVWGCGVAPAGYARVGGP